MPTGLEITFDVLARTNNEAAAAALLPALDSPHQEIRDGALRAILDRRSPAGQREVLRRLQTIDSHWRAIIDQRRGRLSHAVRDAVLSHDDQTCQNGCLAVQWFREYDAMPALVIATEDEANPHRDLAGRTLVQLAELLYQQLAAPRDYSDKRDPQLVRQHVTQTLEDSVKRYAWHNRVEPLEAFLILANRDNATLKSILRNPHGPTYLILVDLLTNSPRPGVMRLVLNWLDDPTAPSAAMNVIAHRCDVPFVKHLTRKIGYEPSAAAAANLKRMESIPWLTDRPEVFDSLDNLEQYGGVQMVMRSGVKRLAAFETIGRLLTRGNVGGRRAASRALGDFNGAAANDLARRAADDPDPQVQANALVQLRPRGIPGAMTRLIDAIDSPNEVVRRAARESLSEFSFRRFLGSFEMLDDDVRRSTGALVRKIDLTCAARLSEEFAARSRMRRIRGLAVAAALGAVEELESQIIALLDDEDHVVRAEAARALSSCSTAAARDALHGALMDRSVTVQEAAERSLSMQAQGAGPLPTRPMAPEELVPPERPLPLDDLAPVGAAARDDAAAAAIDEEDHR